MRENKDQENSVFEHFSRSDSEEVFPNVFILDFELNF